MKKTRLFVFEVAAQYISAISAYRLMVAISRSSCEWLLNVFLTFYLLHSQTSHFGHS